MLITGKRKQILRSIYINIWYIYGVYILYHTHTRTRTHTQFLFIVLLIPYPEVIGLYAVLITQAFKPLYLVCNIIVGEVIARA